MEPQISIVIPAFNPGELIRDTLYSILSQTYSDFEVIIVDDGSTDNTSEIVRSIKDARIRYYYQDNSGLPAKSRNKGVDLSKGNYIGFIDADDLWLPEKLQKQVEIIKKYPDVALVSTNAFYLYDKQKTVVPILKKLSEGFFDNKSFFPENMVIQSTSLVKKDAFYIVGALNENRDLIAVEDYDLWVRIFIKYPCYYMDECLAYYRVTNTSISGGTLKSNERRVQYLKRYFSDYGFDEKINSYVLANATTKLALVEFLTGSNKWRESIKESFSLRKSLLGLFMYALSLLPFNVLGGVNVLQKIGFLKIGYKKLKVKF